MAGHTAWAIGCFVTGCFLLPPTSNVFGHFHAYPSHYQSWLHYQPPPPPRPPRQPIDLMTDAINRLGMRVLQQYVEPGNVAFSPAGLGFILAALYEGSAGKSRQQIIDCLGLPHDRNVVRVGMRDIHMRLRTYLNPDGFLGGLNLNRENTSLRGDYEGILRFYGFDLTIDFSNFAANATAGNFGLKGSMTTTPNPLSTQALTTNTQAATVTTTPMVDMTMTTMPPTTANVVAADGGAGAGTAAMTTTTTAAPTTTIDTSVVIITNPTTMSTTAAQIATTPAPTTTAATTPAPTTTTTAATTPPPTTTAATTPPTPANIQATTLSPTTTTTMPTTTTTQATTTTAMPTTTTTMQPTTTTMQPMTTTMLTTAALLLSSTLPRVTLGPTSDDGLPTTTQFMILEDIATVLPPTLIPSFRKKRSGFNRIWTRADPNGDRRRRSYSEGFFSSYPDEGLWMQDLGFWSDQQQQLQIPSNIRDPGELQFLVNGCEFASVPAASYTSILPFAYFPTLKASALEFPLDNPRYNVLILLPNEKHDAQRLSRELSGQNLRLLRNQLQPTTVRATIPSFSLRGFVTLTSYLQRLGVRDVFEPRLADLSPMTPDRNVYARDIQQSIAVNIRNYMNGDANGMQQNPMQADLSQRRDAWRYQRPVNDRYNIVPFVADHPFLYFIIDDETSVALIAGRIDDPLNSRIL